jgi:kynurenine 3-monooxygenase
MRIRDTGKVTIVGAGMSGTLLAILLAQRGFESELFEQNADPRRGPAPNGGPKTLALGERGRFALRSAGLEKSVGRIVTRMGGRMIHDRAGKTTLQPYGAHAYEALYSISRERLTRCMLDAAEATGRVSLRFGQSLKAVDWDTRRLLFNGAGEQRFEVLFGTDGAGSGVRRAMQDVPGLQVQQDLLDAGWKGLSIPPRGDGKPPLDPGALHVWPRGGYMMIAMPDIDGSFAAMLFLPRTGDHRIPWGFAELDSWIRQEAFMDFNFPDAAPLIADLEAEFRDHPVGLMGTILCSRWHVGGQALLIGDAAHTFVPFHGQGVNAAFEDCTALMDILDGGATEWAAAFSRLQQARKDDADAMAEMALDAYRTIRDSVRQREFLLRKALERELERRHPGLFVARYALVMFHRLPYAEAHRRGRLQAAILDELLQDKHELTEIDLNLAARLVSERLTAVRNPL